MQTPSKKKRKIVKKLLLLLLGIFFIFIVVTEDLESYSIYYEEQLATSEKERRDNVIKATIINLRTLSYKDIPNMRYDFDGVNFVENQNDSSGSYFPFVSGNVGGYSYYDKEYNSYNFDANLNLRYGISSTEHKVLDSTQLNEEQIKDEMYETIRPIIEAQDKPGSFNLLWLYKLVRK
ncbi:MULTISPECIES: hypothetical protein [unclassified Streptococcus]|uniref:hypothetical protein n=1 Tax=unclassified Streptococcus TaxID=2608887 RepID=UPI001071AE1C|nr:MULTISPECIES: hypothetical protein [unclassified Streptococcus]MBF0786355.1 hypothetical protein [Streptococcus sp. 19428wC2_LYSM12]MCQ9212463.1 hypothetical protein [Streptococcus sp. B01]MCQ9213802.1 hypothetical protein [Streptococcus sp. O1]TFV06765.1 hypothetical protein E4T79_00195 [Streptococcus sp. LYSM12]